MVYIVTAWTATVLIRNIVVDYMYISFLTFDIREIATRQF